MMHHQWTTPVTDFIITAETLVLAALLFMGGHRSSGAIYWIVALICLGMAALLGGFFHLLGEESLALFRWVYLFLAVMMASMIMASLADALGQAAALRYAWIVGVAALVFFAFTWLYPYNLAPFAVFEAVVLIAVLIVYCYLMLSVGLPGAGYIALGITITLVGALLYLKGVGVTLIWELDRNDVCHLIQAGAVFFFYLGLRLR